MKRHFFLDKTATIIRGKLTNTGLNPIVSLVYGNAISRGLIHFNEDDIRAWIDDENIVDTTKLHFKLHMTNCFSVDSLPYDKEIVSAPGTLSERASSFGLDFFVLNKHFDAGRGYEYDSDFAIRNGKSYSEQGANWKFAYGSTEWDKPGAYTETSEKINDEPIHFDFGNENIDVDITEYVLSVLKNERDNFGIGIKFDDSVEFDEKLVQQYVGFFSDHTNTFFHPFIEAVYDDVIKDDRAAFYNGKTNRLYLYTFADGQRIKLDATPTCRINESQYPVKVSSKGAFYIEVNDDFGDNTVNYDEWSNIIIDGTDYGNVCLEFVALPKSRMASVGTASSAKESVVPSISGIEDSEELHRGEIREVTVDYRKKYSTDKKEVIYDSEYRIYIKDGRREFDVFAYQPVERGFLNNFFVINTDDLIPGKYYVDIRTKIGRETKYTKDALHFIVKDDVTERYY